MKYLQKGNSKEIHKIQRKIDYLQHRTKVNKWQGPALGVRSYIYCTVLYCTVQYCTVLYCTVLYSTVLYCTVLYISHNRPGPPWRAPRPTVAPSCRPPVAGRCRPQPAGTSDGCARPALSAAPSGIGTIYNTSDF